jgi:integrase
MSSLYLRGEVWWAKSKEQGQVVRWSLKTQSKVEAKRRLKLYDSQPRPEPMPTRVKSPMTWDEAGAQLLDWYAAYGSRRVPEAAGKVRTLSRYFTGRKLVDIDAVAILGYVAYRRKDGLAAASINVELATLRKGLRLAHEMGHLASVPRIRTLKPAAPRSGFFEPEQFERVCQQLPVDLQVAVRIAYSYGWRVSSEVLPLARANVNLDAGTLRLAPGTTKNGDGRLVYLTPELKRDLAGQITRVRALEQEMSRVIPYLFPVPRGPRKGRQRRDIQRAWGVACQRAGLLGMLRHDLRRSAVRNMVQAGISERVAMTITGHRTRLVFDRYHIVSPGDLRDAVRKMSYTIVVQSGAQRWTETPETS